MIYNFHKTENARVSVRKLEAKMERELGWSGSLASAKTVVRNLGFRWRNTVDNRQLLVEKSDIRALRISYIQEIRFFRGQGRPVVYLDETYIHSGHTPSKSWSDNTGKGLVTNISKGQRLIIVHAGGDMGFIPNACLIFKSGTKFGDYHDEMNSTNYEKWLREKLIPNLPAKSVIVVDNASYHSVLLDPAPTSTLKKQWYGGMANREKY